MDAAIVLGQPRRGRSPHRLLAFARPQPLDPQPHDVNRADRRHGRPAPPQRGRAGARADLALEAGIWPAPRRDANQLENAILNLVDQRARRHARRAALIEVETAIGRPSTSATAATMDGIAPGDYVAISVKDTGTGMTGRGAGQGVRPVLHHQADRPGAPAWACR